MTNRVASFKDTIDSIPRDLLSKIEELLFHGERSRRVVALTGAGASRGSGIPTFRGPNGLYKGKDPMELASPQGFRKDPKLVWEWYQYRISLIQKAKPNPIHYFLAELETDEHLNAIITQNVDDLHERAGSKHVIHLHGEIMKYECTSCSYHGQWTTADFTIPPSCPECGALLRPSVVWFGESLPYHALEASMDLARSCETCLVIGTSGVVYPAASIPLIAKKNGATIIEFNIQESELSAIADYLLLGPSEIIMEYLREALRKRRLEK